jgi:hypothetical protein
MWLFTKHGYFSAVNARQGNDSRNLPHDPDRIIIRTRQRSHMDNLVKRFPILEQYPIDEDKIGARDYKYLMFVPKTLWADIVRDLAMEMDYPKFKPSIVEFDGKHEYHQALLDVWQRMYETQT